MTEGSEQRKLLVKNAMHSEDHPPRGMEGVYQMGFSH